MEQQIQTIREACIKANRFSMLHGAYCGKHKGTEPETCELCRKTVFREVRLADVLLAMDNAVGGDTEKIKKNLIALYDLWRLTKDDLRSQSKETIEFIYNLLKS